MDQSEMLQDVPALLSQDEEASLVKAAQQDPAAFAQLYRRYIRPIYRYLYSRSGQASDAEDLTAQVFLEAIEGLARYRPNGPFAAWLFTIARRRAIDHLRRGNPITALSEQAEPIDPAVDPLTKIIQGEEIQLLHKQIAGLKDGDQELLRLRFAAGLSFNEIARILKRSEAAVKMNLYRTLHRLESQMEKNHE
jgi:RNA polymerase sigma-70 factor (ECF subfamily)